MAQLLISLYVLASVGVGVLAWALASVAMIDNGNSYPAWRRPLVLYVLPAVAGLLWPLTMLVTLAYAIYVRL